MSEHESIPPSDPQRDVEPHEVRKKSSPSPLVRATDTNVEARPVSPVRRVGVPLAMAAAIALATGGSAYAIGRNAEKITATIHDKTPKSDDLKQDIQIPIPPASDAPRLAGEMAPPMPVTSSNPAPVPSSAIVPPPKPAQQPILPHPNPPPMPGGISMPRHQPVGGSAI